MKYIIESEEELSNFIKEIAPTLISKVVFLEGEMGAGKTTFVRYFLGSDISSSPTFSLENRYSTLFGEVLHYDLYRMESEIELEMIGFFDSIRDAILDGQTVFIEWANKFKLQFESFVRLKFSILSETSREIEVEEIK